MHLEGLVDAVCYIEVIFMILILHREQIYYLN